MQCQELRLTKSGQAVQCKQKAVNGYNMCRQHGWRCKFYIGYAWQENPGDHWTAKKKACWPILFADRESAHAHMDTVSIFKNMGFRRKLTACVERTKRTHPVPGLRAIGGLVK